MDYTEKHHLPKWAKTDRIQMQDFNDAMDNIEKGLDGLAHGALQVTCGTYTGDSTYGQDHLNRLEFPFKPLLVIVFNPKDVAYGGKPWLRGMSKGVCLHNDGHPYSVHITWEDQGLSWWGDSSQPQLNEGGLEYPYIAIGLPV